MIEWIEPRIGVNADGQHVDALVVCKAMDMDVAKLQRNSILATAIRHGKLPIHMDEAELIEDFMAVHQARRVQEW